MMAATSSGACAMWAATGREPEPPTAHSLLPTAFLFKRLTGGPIAVGIAERMVRAAAPDPAGLAAVGDVDRLPQVATAPAAGCFRPPLDPVPEERPRRT